MAVMLMSFASLGAGETMSSFLGSFLLSTIVMCASDYVVVFGVKHVCPLFISFRPSGIAFMRVCSWNKVVLNLLISPQRAGYYVLTEYLLFVLVIDYCWICLLPQDRHIRGRQ